MNNNYATQYIDKLVEVIIDRPLGSKHPKHGFVYEVNYGYVDGVMAPDGEELDAYVLGVNHKVEKFTGTCIAVIHRLDDDDDKLIVVPNGIKMTDEEILQLVHFQEKWFKSELIK